MEEFHIRNVIGCCERRQFMFGDRVTIPAGITTLAVTLSGLTGALVEKVDHFQVLAQKLNAIPVNLTYLTSKTTRGFTLNGDAGADYSIIVLATLPTNPLAHPKWAKDYCPYCKNLDFKGIVGSTLRDIVVFDGTATTGGGGTVAAKFATMTRTTAALHGMVAGNKTSGTLKNPLVTMMAGTDYQICLTKTTEAGGVVTNPPYPSAIAKDGFTINGDATQDYDVLILGQIQF
jgi:hypothetical protein